MSIFNFHIANTKLIMDIKINCFISYSHDDTELKTVFNNHLAEFFNELSIQVWSDSLLNPGQNWYYKIDEKLEESNIIFCLISNNFIKSDPCQDELNRAMDRYRNGSSLVVPIMLTDKEVNIQDLSCSDLHFTPVVEGRIKPINDWSSPSDGFKSACIQLKTTIEDLLKELRSKDRSWRFQEIQDLVALSKIRDALKKMLSFSREFCGHDSTLQTKVCRNMGAYNLLENQLKENPGEIIDKVMDLLIVMDDLHREAIANHEV